MRYYLLREMVFGQDCNFSYDAIVQRWNSDLANDLGNLLSRTSAMILKYREGKVPAPGNATGDEEVRNLAARVVRDYRANFEDYSFSRALENIWELIARVNKYIVENEPWAIAEKPAESAKARQRAVSFRGGPADYLRSPGCGNAEDGAGDLGATWPGWRSARRVVWISLEWSNVLAGKSLRPGSSLFPRLDRKVVMEKLDAALEAKQGPSEKPADDRC